LELREYRLRLKNGTFREGILLENDGCFGDIAPLPGFSRETLEDAKEEALHTLRTGAPPTLPSVRFAFTCASTPLPPTLSIATAALDRQVPGFRVLKFKLGHLTLDEAVEKIKSLPKHVQLRVDFNQQWPLEKLLRFASHFTPKDFDYLEEPTKSFDDLLIFSKETRMPIAVDESIPYVPYWEIPTLKTLVVKPTILGEVPDPKGQAELIFTSAYESGIGLLHIARLAQQHNPDRPHGFDPYTQLLDDVLTPRPVIADGFLTWQCLG